MVPEDKPRILAVDDVPDNLELIREVFENEPYDIATALNAEEALQLAREAFPDVAIVDVQMPDVGGYELCRKLRELTHSRRLPVVFLTANRTSAGDVVQGLDAGGCDYITKPFDAEELRARIRAVIRTQDEHDLDVAGAKTVTRRLLGR
jgi:DNA-binding response OmpR family regulator